MIAGSIPKKGKDALPGLVGVTPAKGVMTLEPVSVCQYVYVMLVEAQESVLDDIRLRRALPPCQQFRNTISRLLLQLALRLSLEL